MRLISRLWTIAAAGIVIGVFVSAMSVHAHHSNAAQYDASKRTTIKGEVFKVEWTNPHAYLYLDVKDASGKVARWSLEGFPPNTLLRTGWKTSMLKTGDIISVEGALARDGSNLLLAREVTLKDGQKLYWGPQS
ncbi:MAG TPA: DUF6152 family protein [Terriglobia bacterium]|nr:DUF6152 family protein [Terriglobia bacterium]